jgi:uncharacterized protein YqhQ
MPECKKTSIGGQALIEGVMMKGPQRTAMAVRRPDGGIHIEMSDLDTRPRPWYKKTPIIRGGFNFIESLSDGYRYLLKSADLASEEEVELTGFDKKLQDWFGDKSGEVIAGLAMVLALGLAVGLFMVLPTFLGGLLQPYIASPVMMAFVESALKISIFVAYILLASRTEDMKRIFQYHGAEHQTIACYEQGRPLTAENAAEFSRIHPRCSTSFILIVMVVSVLVFSMVSWSNIWMRIALKLLSLPLVVGLSYEVFKLTGRYDNPLTRAISAPGLWLQRLTTRPPDLTQLEVAVAALKPCIPEDGELDRY